VTAYGLPHSQIQQNIRPISAQLNSMTYPRNIPNNYNKFNEYKKPVKFFSDKE
jgi:hypothetical protein